MSDVIIPIAFHENHTRPAPQPFAIHTNIEKTDEAHWRLTHLPTGRAVESHQDVARLRTLAIRLRDTGVNWNTIDFEVIQEDPAWEKAREVTQKWRIENATREAAREAARTEEGGPL